MMSELRKDLVSGRWVIIATERSKRPDDFRPRGAAAPAPEAAGFCPFCEGNECKTPPEVFALRAAGTAPDAPGWTVRVVPNKFPALSPGPPPPKADAGRLPVDGRAAASTRSSSRTPTTPSSSATCPIAHIRDVLEVFQHQDPGHRVRPPLPVRPDLQEQGQGGRGLAEPPPLPDRGHADRPQEGQGGDLRRRPAVPGVQGMRLLPDLRDEEAGRRRGSSSGTAISRPIAPFASRFPVRDGRSTRSAIRPSSRTSGRTSSWRWPATLKTRPDPAQGDRRRSALQPGPPSGAEPGLSLQGLAGDRPETSTGTWRSSPS